ncbi:TPA: hypothetical protein L4847_006089 [Pseudomonas aeruginosa]|nr:MULTISPECIES: hypothetical protein [Pseudomonas]EKL0659782.1 hypothetical protein [Pseudomonas aeruginosa]EKL8242299.1 hypothetical protein [Pseudomonas aeruginosa]EKL8600617.1 hypothetical protein [Pseudomonas aeruginosa]EKP5709764.1 hypothetical protein [Pseudomonas aeruginosa]EKT0600595.1 hypothetical protein [Pseudomonas aeruginosa]
MSDLWKTLCFVLVVVLAVLLLVIFFVLINVGAEGELLSAANQVGSILGGLGGIGAAVCAGFGVSVWRQQILTSRRVQHILDAQVSIRKYLLALRQVNLYVKSLAETDIGSYAEKALLGQVDAAIAMQLECMNSCAVVDVIVENGAWIWSPQLGKAAEAWVAYHGRTLADAQAKKEFDGSDWFKIEEGLTAISEALGKLLDKHTKGG